MAAWELGRKFTGLKISKDKKVLNLESRILNVHYKESQHSFNLEGYEVWDDCSKVSSQALCCRSHSFEHHMMMHVRVQIGVTWNLWGIQVPRLQKSVEEGNVRRETWRVGWTNNDFVAAIAIVATIAWTIASFCAKGFGTFYNLLTKTGQKEIWEWL